MHIHMYVFIYVFGCVASYCIPPGLPVCSPRTSFDRDGISLYITPALPHRKPLVPRDRQPGLSALVSVHAWVRACTVACIAASNRLPPFPAPQRGRKSAALAASTLQRCDDLGLPMEAVVDQPSPKRIGPALAKKGGPPPEKKSHDAKVGDAEAR
eukprot:GHVU01146254.1.p1 GENE.GHVU01146254.1~~GHVU01146254.1.p1  ORF type:complete len:155 (-),score=5.58 GHVU01146254.1:485-949(-)